MNTRKQYRQGAIGAILDEYERALNDLISLLHKIPESDYLRILDKETTDPDCHSVQTIIKHVIRSGYGYPNYIRPFFQLEIVQPEVGNLSKADAVRMLGEMFAYNEATFTDRYMMSESEMEAIEFTTRWGPRHTLESMMEHATVHVLRHRRQIEKLLGV